MAEFNRPAQTAAEPVPAYVNSGGRINYPGNRSLGIIGQGISKALGQGIQGLDDRKKTEIQETAFAAQDGIIGELGVDDALGLNETRGAPGSDTSGGSLPSGLAADVSGLEALQAGVESGRLTKTYVLTRQKAALAQMLQQYPGYETEVRQAFNAATGFSSGDLAAHVISELGSASTKAATTREKRIQKMVDDGFIEDPGIFENFTDKQVLEYQATLNFVERSKEAANEELAQARLVKNDERLSEADRRLAEKDSEKRAGQLHAVETRNTVASTIKLGLTQIDMNGTTFEDLLTSDKILDQQEIDTLDRAFKEMDNNINIAFDKLETRQFSPGDTDLAGNYAGMVPHDQLQANRAEALRTWNSMKEAILTGDRASIKRAKFWADNMTDTTRMNVMRDNPGMVNIGIYKEVMGEQMATFMIQSNEGLLETTVTMLTRDLQNQSVSGVGPTSSFGEDLEKVVTTLPEEDNVASQAFKANALQWQRAAKALGKEVDTETLGKYARYSFDPVNMSAFSKLDPSGKKKYLDWMTGPEIAKSMLKLKESGDEEAYALYRQWTLNATVAVGKNTLDSLANFNLNTDLVKMVWDPKGKKFHPALNPNAETLPVPPGSQNQPGGFNREELAAGITKEFRGDIDGLNQLITTLLPILEEDGLDAGQGLMALFQTLGFTNPVGLEGQRDAVDDILDALEAGTPDTGDPGGEPEDHSSYFDDAAPFLPRFASPDEPGVTGDQAELSPGDEGFVDDLKKPLTPEEIEAQTADRISGSLRNDQEDDGSEQGPLTDEEAQKISLRSDDVIDVGSVSLEPEEVEVVKTSSLPREEANLLDFLALAEGTTKGGNEYNVTLGFGMLTGPTDLVNMTFAEVDAMQTQMLRHPKNRWNASPAGRYQVVRKTLRKARKALGLKPTDLYNEENQDKIGRYLLRGRGYDKYLAGAPGWTKGRLVNELAKEWASLPNSRGRSHYGGKTRVSLKDLLALL